MSSKINADAELDDIRTNAHAIQSNTSPTSREEKTQSTGTNEPEIPYERSEVAVDP